MGAQNDAEHKGDGFPLRRERGLWRLPDGTPVPLLGGLALLAPLQHGSAVSFKLGGELLELGVPAL
jgi:hypothetical protein